MAATPEQVTREFNLLNPEEKERVRAALDPSRILKKDLKSIWLTLLWILGVIAGGAVAAGVVLLLNDKDAAAVWPIATLVLGGLVGLMAPSPASGGGSGS